MTCRPWAAASVALAYALTALPAIGAAPLVFSAPPRDTGESEADVYEPIAKYFSIVTGKKVEYRFARNWLTYQDSMRKGEYDIVFDGPHFVSWRVARLQHEPLAKLAGKLGFVVAVKKDNDKILETKDLAGRTVCGLAPPNLATLTMYAQFDNPARQPLVREVKSFKDAYDGMINGKCMAAVLRDNAFAKFDEEKNAARAIYRSEGIANQAFSAGPRVTPEDRAKITEALLRPQAKRHMSKFFERYSKDKDLMPASRSEYDRHYVLLKDVWGFEIAREVLSAPGGR